MPSRFRSRILTLVADKRYKPIDDDAIAESLGVDTKDRPAFDTAIEDLLGDEKVIREDDSKITLPSPGSEIEGVLRRHPNGFGFLIPDTLVAHGDLFVPPPFIGNAMTGDRVLAEVVKEEGRAAPGKSPFIAKIKEITERADRRYAGVLESKETDGGMKYRVIVDRPAPRRPDPHPRRRFRRREGRRQGRRRDREVPRARGGRPARRRDHRGARRGR